MTLPHRLPAVAAVALLLGGCASTYDQDRIDRRTRSLHARAPQSRFAPDVGAPPAAERQPPPADRGGLETADLSRYIEYGLAHSAELRASFEHWRALGERVQLSSTLPDPRLSYGEFLEDVQTRTGPQERRVGISQAFPWPGKLGAQARVADREAESAWYGVEAERLRITAEIEIAYHEYAFLGRELGITEELLKLLRGLEPVVQSRVRGGAGQEGILRLQVEIGRLEDELAGLARRKPALSARLVRAMNITDATRVLLPMPELAEPRTRVVDVSDLHTRALERNPHLHALTEQLAARRESENVAGYRRKPSFALGLDYLQTGGALSSSTSGSGDDPVLVSLSMSLPVWTSSYSAAEREARHLMRSSRARLEAAASSLRASIEEEAYRVDDAARRIGLYRDSLIPRASETLQLTLASYRTGQASVLDLIDSERALLEFELSFWRACREFLQGDARLRALTGDSR